MKIHSKIVLSLLSSATLVIMAMYALMQWSFQHNLYNYVSSRDLQRHQTTLKAISAHYRQHQGWQALDNTPNLFQHPGTFGRPQRGGSRKFPPKAILDQNKAVIYGRLPRNARLVPIESAQQIIGYLAVPAFNRQLEANELAFKKSQLNALLSISLAAVLFSLLIALPLARHIVKPIEALTVATRKLNRGNYQVTLNAAGNDEIAGLSKDVAMLAHTLQDNELSRQRWIADISHELRTPLAITKGEIEAMLDGVRPMDKQQLLSLQQEIHQLESFANDLYQLTNTDIGGLRYQMEMVDLGEKLNDIKQRHQSSFTERGLELTLTLPSHPVKLITEADPDRLQQCFDNILNNCHKYVADKGLVRITLQVIGARLVTTIDDSGPGVSDTALPKLFNYLYRAETSRNRKTGGSGLGLAICRRIIEAHHGTIKAEHSALGGLKITIELPGKIDA